MGAQNRNTKTVIAKSDLSAKTGYGVYLNGETDGLNIVAAICGANARAYGFIENPPSDIAKPMTIVTRGECYAYAGGTVDEGDPLKTDSNGAVVEAGTDKDRVVGIALQASSGSELIKIEVEKYEISST